jgi:tryptophan synthase alpha chain
VIPTDRSPGRGQILTDLEKHLRSLRDSGRSALVIYLTGGFPHADSLALYAGAVADAGADLIEVGIPWSDPVIDGSVIQRSSQAALDAGVTPLQVLDSAARADVALPIVCMTYYNPVLRMGVERFARELSQRGLAGAIIPDLPLEESGPWEVAAADAEVAAVLLAPPNAPDERLAEIGRRASGFVYAMTLLGVTGPRSDLSKTAAALGSRVRAVTDRPVLLGIGISDAKQAATAAAHADGVIVGSAVIGRILEGAGPHEIADFVSELRSALDRGLHG